jgi:ComF family protein
VILVRALVDALAPPRCAGCDWFLGAAEGADAEAANGEERMFCEFCLRALRAIAPPLWPNLCFCCGEPFDALACVPTGSECALCRESRYHGRPPVDRARSLWEFVGPLRRAVHRFKYGGRHSLAAPLGASLSRFLEEQAGLFPAVEAVVPVPLHPWRAWRRGFNQSDLLAAAVAKRRGLPCARLLRRRRYSATQTSLGRSERAVNVRGVFAIDEIGHAKYLGGRAGAGGAKIAGRGALLLVDDVWTTGATLNECARVLKERGWTEVYALTLARQLKS